MNERCSNPCPGSCGVATTCIVLNHSPICQCDVGFTGDPFVGCSPVPGKIYLQKVVNSDRFMPLNIVVLPPPSEVSNPCDPSPCGANAICKERNGAGSCICLPEYFGDPYVACKPECVINTDCPRDKACINNKCKNPCLGTCGTNAECEVLNHVPSCFCIDGYTGNPAIACHLLPRCMYFIITTSSISLQSIFL